MYVNNEYRPNISINLDNGVYIFDSDLAIGKTYLCKQLKKLKAYGEPVESYTYNDILCGVDIDKISGDYKVIMLDRYDMYKGIGQNLINRYKDKSIILIDYKEGYIPYVENEICFIDLTENSIEVSHDILL